METERFVVRNIKCGGCANTIRQGLQQIDGIEDVAVVVDTGEVIVSGNRLVRSHIAGKLGELGYPEHD